MAGSAASLTALLEAIVGVGLPLGLPKVPIVCGGGGCNRPGYGLLEPELSPALPTDVPDVGGMNSRIPDMLNFFKVVGSSPRLLRSLANCDMELPARLEAPLLP